MAHAFQFRLLRKAARLAGGPERLRELLDAPPGAFCRWLEGDELLPERFQRMLLDFLSDMESTSTLPHFLIYPPVRGNDEQRQRNAEVAHKP
jgi:hypothetical protein